MGNFGILMHLCRLTLILQSDGLHEVQWIDVWVQVQENQSELVCPHQRKLCDLGAPSQEWACAN